MKMTLSTKNNSEINESNDIGKVYPTFFFKGGYVISYEYLANRFKVKSSITNNPKEIVTRYDKQITGAQLEDV